MGEGATFNAQGFSGCEFENLQCMANTNSGLKELPRCEPGNAMSTVNFSGANKKKDLNGEQPSRASRFSKEGTSNLCMGKFDVIMICTHSVWIHNFVVVLHEFDVVGFSDLKFSLKFLFSIATHLIFRSWSLMEQLHVKWFSQCSFPQHSLISMFQS